MAVSAQNLIDRARQRADFVSSPFLTDSTELLDWVRNSYYELQDLLIEAHGPAYFTNEGTLSVSASTGMADLTTLTTSNREFLKLVRLDRTVNGERVPLRPFSLSDATLSTTTQGWDSGVDVRYHLELTQIRFQPIPSSTATVNIFYIPRAIISALATNILSVCEMWDEYIVLDLAIKMREKEESDISGFMAAKDRMRLRVMQAAGDRDAGQPTRVVDVRGFDEYEWGDWGDGLP